MTDEQVRIDLLRDYIDSASKMTDDLAGGMGVAQAFALHAARCVAADIEAVTRQFPPSEPAPGDRIIVHGEMAPTNVVIGEED